MHNQQYIENLCCNIRTLRTRENLTEDAMAERLGIPAEAVQAMENGVMPENLEVKTLVQIEHEFGISLKDIFLPL